MELDEFKAAHPIKKQTPYSTSKIIDLPDEPVIPHRPTVMGPHRPLKNMSNLDAGLCPICQGMVKEVAPAVKRDFRIVNYVCVENDTHRFCRSELDRKEPSKVQQEAWASL